MFVSSGCGLEENKFLVRTYSTMAQVIRSDYKFVCQFGPPPSLDFVLRQ